MGIQPPEVVTTQRTAKRFKAIMLVGVAGLFASPFPAAYGVYNMTSETQATQMVWVSAGIAAVALAVYLVGHGLAWWYHE